MKAWGKTWVLMGALLPLLAITVAYAAERPVTVKCSLKMKYSVHTERPTVDAVNRYVCKAEVIASSDVDAVDAVDLATRQVVFALDNCPRLPERVVFGDRDVTEVRARRGSLVKAHLFAGECKGCVISANTDVSNAQLDSGHFDATFLVRPVAITPQEMSIMLPAGKGRLTLRSERTDDMIVRGGWAARRCRIFPTPPIFCGGIEGKLCPDGLECVDYPGDKCDPGEGHADCIGICVEPGS